MGLSEEITSARKNIISDGYDMSVGELINLYKDDEIFINPEFQRMFRWDESRKTRFIESLLLGIPIPPIFVYQNKNKIWELIDGLQRVSTLLEFVGVLKKPTGELYEATVLTGTKLLPSLDGKIWDGDDEISIGRDNQLVVKRARVRVEILKQESDPQAKYELFQRLNTGGIALSPQEVRNCVTVMINASFYEWLSKRANDVNFRFTIDQTPAAIEKQSAAELALRFFAFRNVPYKTGWDVHEYLDDALLALASDDNFKREQEEDIFTRTFTLLKESLGADSFKRWDGSKFTGQFLMSLFEVIAIGVSNKIDAIEKLGPAAAKAFLENRSRNLSNDAVFLKNSGAGVRGTTRLANLLPLAESWFTP